MPAAVHMCIGTGHHMAQARSIVRNTAIAHTVCSRCPLGTQCDTSSSSECTVQYGVQCSTTHRAWPSTSRAAPSPECPTASSLSASAPLPVPRPPSSSLLLPLLPDPSSSLLLLLLYPSRSLQPSHASWTRSASGTRARWGPGLPGAGPRMSEGPGPCGVRVNSW